MLNKKLKVALICSVMVCTLLLSSCALFSVPFFTPTEDGDEENAEVSTEVFVEESSEESSVKDSSTEPLVSTENNSLEYTPEEYVRYGLASAVAKAHVSVVSVVVTSKLSGGFYGDYTVKENGSGVVISEDGYIVTNCHVVEKAESIKIILSTGEEHSAEVIGKDSKTDLAVIKAEAETVFSPATFSHSSSLRLGDFVFAIGNALGKYQGSVTMGIVSALSRDVSVNGEGMKMLQTDAALNSGNSGGGLFDSSGNLVGIVAAKDADESSEGVGFAIPTDVAKVVIEDIIKHGYVTGRPTLGFSTVDITSMREASYYGVDWIGVYISSVVKDGYGEKAGLKPRDYIYSVNSEVITTTDRIKEILEESKVGDTLLLEVWRGSDAIDVVLVIGEEVS